jgi:CRP-like cAMP-binding protein
MFHHIYPSLCLENDMVLRAGEYGDTFYIIKKGRVEVLTPDNKVVLAILEEGSYFGEISILGINKNKRTASIRAMTNCVFLCINDQKFL